MRPVVHGLEAEYWGEIDFVYIDHENSANGDVMRRYGFTWRPLFILVMPDGTEVQRWFGFIVANDFRAAFDSYLAESG